MQPTFSGVLKKSGNSIYLLIPAHILKAAGIDAENSVFKATVDQGRDPNHVEMIVEILKVSEPENAKDAPTA